MMQLTRIIVCLFLPVLLSGCVSIQPAVIEGSGNDYNLAMQRTSNEQMLLNLVRLKYRDTPYFLEVSAVASQFKLSSGASATTNFKAQHFPEFLGLGASIDYAEQPTVSYSPLRGDAFVTRLLERVNINTLLLLYHSGWSVERVLRLCVQRMNGVDNAPTASGPTPVHAPSYRTFLRVSKLLRDLQQRGALDMGYVKRDGHKAPVLYVAAGAHDADAAELRELLHLAPSRHRYWLVAGSGSASKASDRIVLGNRSLLGIMYYLSQSVEVPARDRHAGKVTVTRDASGHPFDWLKVTRHLFAVHSAPGKPTDAAVATHYRGSWFYIDDRDLETKSTFTLLAQLFSLQAGKGESAGPVLTLPVGQ